MKKLFNLFAIAAIAVFTLAGCSKNDQNAPASDSETVHITVKANVQDLAGEPGTKTYIDANKTIIWGTGEYMNIAVATGENTVFGTSNDDSADAANGQAQATFGFDLTLDEADSYTYMGLYPTSAAVAGNENAAQYKVVLPAIQNATADSYDPSAYIMVAKPTEFTTVQTTWMASYRRATALNKVTLTGISEDIVSVEITAPDGKYMAGRRYINLTTGENGQIYNSGSQTETIKVKTTLSGNSKVVWFTSWGIEIPEGDKLKIVAKSATKSYTKVITARATGISFKEGYLNTLGVNMSSVTPEELNELPEGNYLILAKHKTLDLYYALKNEVEGRDRLQYENYDGSLTSFSGDEELVWTVSKVGNNYTISNGNGYLGSSEAKKAFVKEASEYSSTNDYLLSIDKEDDGSYSVYNSNTSSLILAKNESIEYGFGFYEGTMYNNIYFVPASVDNREKVTLSFAESSFGLTTSDYSSFSGQTVTASPVVTDITYTLTGDAIGTIDSSSGTVSLNGSTGQATIKASFAGDDNYRPAEASYSIIVSAPSGEVWSKVTSISDITPGTYVIVNDGYYLPNAAASNAGPIKNENTKVTFAGTSLIDVTNEMQWNFSGNNTDGWTIKSSANDKYLYNINTNSGVRVENTSDSWIISAYPGTTGAFTLKDNNNNRYCASYSQGSDWRSYTSYNATNYGDGGKIYLYKLEDSRADAEISWSASEATATMENSGISFTAPTLNNPNGVSVDYYSLTSSVATIDTDGSITILKAGQTNIVADFIGNTTYKPAAVTYTLTVVDNRTFSITVSQPTSGGTISASTNSAKEGAEITLTPTPNQGYKLKSWSVVGKTSGTNVSVTNNKFTMPAENVEVSAIFEEEGNEKTVTYTVTSTSAVSTSGTAPNNSSATYSSTYGTKCQLTRNNSMTLTLSGYDNKKITGLVLSMKSNASSGSGYMSMVSGSTTIASIGSSSSGVAFSNNSWHGSWSTSYVDITIPVTATTVGTSDNIVITIGATANSLYCESFTIIYE